MDNRILFYRNVYSEQFSTFYKTFVGIALFDELPGQDKVHFRKKSVSFSRTISRLK